MPMQCPRDSSPLQIRDIESHIGYRCPKCRGAWLPSNYLRSIQYARLLPYNAFAKALATAPTKETSLQCPAGCGQLADITSFAPSFSWCRSCHGIWFDRGELRALLAQIPSVEEPYAVVDESTDPIARGSLLPHYHVPPDLRRKYILWSASFIGYGALGLWLDDLYIPGKHGRPGLHLHGVPMWFVVGALAFNVANMISVIVDHYDKRDNQPNYRRFARVTFLLACLLLAVGGFLDIFVFKSSTRHPTW